MDVTSLTPACACVNVHVITQLYLHPCNNKGYIIVCNLYIMCNISMFIHNICTCNCKYLVTEKARMYYTYIKLMLVCLSTGYLNKLSLLIVESFHIEQLEKANVKLLKAATEPFTHYVIKVDTSIISKIALNQTAANTSLIKTNCGSNGTYEKCKRFKWNWV